MQNCPCNSSKSYEKCCHPFHLGAAKPTTAEELMRARYSAYAKGEIDFIYNTLIAANRSLEDLENIKSWSKNSTWLGLQIISVTKGSAQDEDGIVEFIANYSDGKKEIKHSERASFKKVDGEWFFVDGEELKAQTIVNIEPKIGRNDLCSCNSGKKYKKCCGK